MAVIALTGEMDCPGKDVSRHHVNCLNARVMHCDSIGALSDHHSTPEQSRFGRYLACRNNNVEPDDFTFSTDNHMEPVRSFVPTRYGLKQRLHY